MRNPPILISVLGFFALIEGISWVVWGIRLLGFDWFNFLGDMPKYENAGLWGWLSLAVGVIWVAISTGLWTLQPWAWVATMVIAGVNLVVAVLWFFAYPGSGIGFTMSIVPIIILLYLNSGQVRDAFQLDRARAH